MTGKASICEAFNSLSSVPLLHCCSIFQRSPKNASYSGKKERYQMVLRSKEQYQPVDSDEGCGPIVLNIWKQNSNKLMN